MEPMKRMSITVAIILVVAIIALGLIFVMMKKLEKGAKMQLPLESASEMTKKGEGALEPALEKKPSSESETSESAASEPSSSSVAMEEKQNSGSSEAKCDVISDEDMAHYLKIKEALFPVYSENKVQADMMLDQEQLWRSEQIHQHMLILMDMKVKKKQSLRDSGFSEKRFLYITNAMMEWIFRTKEIEYEKKYVGEEDFYLKKIDPIVPCRENDSLFEQNKENILKTFMGDFELVDY